MVESQTSPQTNPRTPCEETIGPPKTYTQKDSQQVFGRQGKHLSNEKNRGWFGCICMILPSYVEIITNHDKDPY